MNIMIGKVSRILLKKKNNRSQLVQVAIVPESTAQSIGTGTVRKVE
jgi:hypothetical protein